MSANVLDVSEGYPVDGQIFEPPQQKRDAEDPHFVTFLGSLIIPETAQDRPWTKFGGIEITNPCLRYVKNFLGKGRITPVLKDTHDWCTQDYWEKATGKDASYFPRQVPKGYVAPDRDEMGNRSGIPPMMGKMALPGDQMDAIVNGSAARLRGVRRGVVELKTLKGQPYNPVPLGDGVVHDATIWQIQRTIFPKYPFLPILLEDIERLLDDATVHTSLRSVVDEMSTSLNQFRDYARATIEQTHYNMRESGQKSESGYIPRYVDLDFVLLEQLGMARQDVAIRKETASPTSDPELREMFKQFIALQVEEKEAIAAERRAQVAQIPVDENTMKAAPPQVVFDQNMIQPTEGYSGYGGQSGYSGFSGGIIAANETIVNDSPESAEKIAEAMADTEPFNPVLRPEQIESPSEFTCSGCGRPSPTLAGLRAHERACEQAKQGAAE
jgi:hypothetical protein